MGFGIAHARYAQLGPNFVTAFVYIALFCLIPGNYFLFQSGLLHQQIGQIIWMSDALNVGTQQLFFRVTNDIAERTIHL